MLLLLLPLLLLLLLLLLVVAAVVITIKPASSSTSRAERPRPLVCNDGWHRRLPDLSAGAHVRLPGPMYLRPARSLALPHPQRPCRPIVSAAGAQLPQEGKAVRLLTMILQCSATALTEQ